MDLLLTAVICVLTFLVLRGGWRQNVRTLNMQPKSEALILGVLAVGAAMYFWGVMMGLALIVSVMVHEYGHVAAYRVAGHPDATFRLIPMFGGVAISKTSPKSDLHDFYITIMGPGICLALMLVSYIAYDAIIDSYYTIGLFFWYLTIVTGMLNFLNLLPLWPLDGGRITRVLTQTFSPKLAFYLTIAMGLMLIAYGVYNRMMLITIFAVLALQGAMNMPTYRTRKGLTTAQMIIGTIAWFAMLGAFFIGGLPFLVNFF